MQLRSPGTDHSRLKPALSSVASHLPCRPGLASGLAEAEEPRPFLAGVASLLALLQGLHLGFVLVGQGLPPSWLSPAAGQTCRISSWKRENPGKETGSQTTSLAAPGWGGLVVCVLEVGTGATG